MSKQINILEKEDSFSIVKKFIKSKGLQIKIDNYLDPLDKRPEILKVLSEDLVESVILDGYDYSKSVLKEIIFALEKKYNILFGNILKRTLKKYIDYRNVYFFNRFYSFLIKINGKSIEKVEILEIINRFLDSEKYRNIRKKALKSYIENLNKALKNNNNSRVYDYLNFIYSRILNFNEISDISLNYLFKINEKIIKREFDDEEYLKLKNFCNNDELREREVIVQNFNRKYISILEKREDYNKKHSVLMLNISNKIFNKINDEELFYSYILSVIKKAYQLIQNHRTLVIKIGNIINNELNIKWKIFSYLVIFAEKFLKQNETRAYYKPEEIFTDTIESLYNFKIAESEIEIITKYYKNKIEIEELSNINVSKIKNFYDKLEDFRYIYTGFTFNDCFILKNLNSFSEQSKEINFIANKNELLLIFTKHKFNDAKIPCPICASLNISGNSFPKIGIRSWECKNPHCAERSKTNRGKRYSERTIFMQDSTLDFSKENLIPKKIVKDWRRDIVEINEIEDILKLIIKYYSFEKDNILILDENEFTNEVIGLVKQFTLEEKRNFTYLSISQIMPLNEFDQNSFKDFFNSSEFSYINHFLSKNFMLESHQYNKDFDFVYNFNNKIKLLHGDCFTIFQQLIPNSIDCMVTSPPYYNAREYSQWSNLYSYLNEMYKIIVVSHYTLKPGGIFLFNIGDIYGNENTTVKSKMGEGRIPLGSYTILLFLKAGFEILDNIIWDKGETQSNRFKNNGNFSPYYQRPANCYEHIFIFKKKGNHLLLNKNKNESIWSSNIVHFSPVIKIGFNGENRHGHSAPFPPDIPLFAITTFTNEGDLVLDPFSGSLTTPITANLNNRIGIGIEMLKEFIKLSYIKAQDKNLSIELYSKKLLYKDIIKELKFSNKEIRKQYFIDEFLE